MRYVLLILLPVIIIKCAANSNLTPLGKGKVSANIDIGGPIVTAFDARIPTPYLSIGVNYGLNDKTNLIGNLHLLSVMYQVMGLDVGAAYFLTQPKDWIPLWGVQPKLMLLSSLKSDVKERTKIYPMLTNTLAWKMGSGLIYTGIDLTYRLTDMDYLVDTPAVIYSPFIGYRWKLSQKYRLLTEIKWQGSNIRSDQVAVEYVPIGGYGAITTLFGLERSF